MDDRPSYQELRAQLDQAYADLGMAFHDVNLSLARAGVAISTAFPPPREPRWRRALGRALYYAGPIGTGVLAAIFVAWCLL